MKMGKVDYKGHCCHGKTLPFVREREYLGMPMVVLRSGELNEMIPAANVQVFEVPK